MIKCMLDNYFIPHKIDCLTHADPKIYIIYPPMIMMLYFIFIFYPLFIIMFGFSKKNHIKIYFFQIIDKGSGTKHGHIPQFKK
jgi:hypothetical protein